MMKQYRWDSSGSSGERGPKNRVAWGDGECCDAGVHREGFLPSYGNYRALKSFQKAEIVYDLT
jgi:hypothetical protein